MKITYLGHAGFYVATETAVIIMDPWVSPFGAFDSAWFQYPKNSHMADYVLQDFEDSPKDKFIYISHEHKDHFDMAFLNRLQKRNFKFILANFHRSIVKETLKEEHYQCEDIISLDYDGEVHLKDGSIRLFMLDAEIDCDSAILVKTKTRSFLNLNDCKLHEKLPKINRLYGPIDVFAAQFSGAIWHPVCYELSIQEYQRISLSKKMNKFSIVSKAINDLNPKVYIPSAGPPCFLDPMLMPINFEKINIFPRAAEFITYLSRHCKATGTKWPEIMPGDILNADTFEFDHLVAPRLKDSDFKEYVRNYASEYADYFKQRALENSNISPVAVFVALKKELEEKMAGLKLVNVTVESDLYWKISDYPDWMYRVNFTERSVTATKEISNPENYWLIQSPAWEVNKVLNKEMNWPDFVLTFRVKLLRIPNLYNTVIHGFIAVDTPEMDRFSELVMKFHANNQERTIIEHKGKRYSILRWCPHLGGDLSAGWMDRNCWVCPRHQWHFDLENGGKCVNSTDSIDAICLEDEEEKKKSEGS